MKAKKIMTIISISLLTISIILMAITLIHYYKYVGIINTIKSADIDWLTKYELHQQRDLYLYRSLSLLVWTVYVGIATCISALATIIMYIPRKKIEKIR